MRRTSGISGLPENQPLSRALADYLLYGLIIWDWVDVPSGRIRALTLPLRLSPRCLMFGSSWSLTDIATFIVVSCTTGWLASRRSSYLQGWSESPWIFFICFYVISVVFLIFDLEILSRFSFLVAAASAIQGRRLTWRRSVGSVICILGGLALYPIVLVIMNGTLDSRDFFLALLVVPVWVLAAFIADGVATKFRPLNNE